MCKHFKYICLVLGILLTTFYISNHWCQLLLVRGESMAPAYHDMQLVLLDRRSDKYTYGDVIAFRSEALDSVLIKRIAACPGDEAVIRDGMLFVNGSVSNVFPQENLFVYAGLASKLVCLGEEQYFVIGDNVAQSRDSRYAEIGLIGVGAILGKVD